MIEFAVPIFDTVAGLETTVYGLRTTTEFTKEPKPVPNSADRLVAIAKDVYRVLGSGYSEDVYERAMQVGLRLAKIRYEGQKVVELKYRDHCVGEGYPDLVVRHGREPMVVEFKAMSGELGAPEERQLRNYMKILKTKRGLLINFQQPGRNPRKTKLEIREVEGGQTTAVTAMEQAVVDTHLFALAVRSTKAQLIKVYGPKGPAMTWAQRAKAGVDAKHFQEALKARS